MHGLTRRRALQFLGGGMLGTMLSPLPWKLLDDLSIWTQNGPQVPRIPVGPWTTRFTHCNLCPAGCGLQVRCVGDRPVAVTGVHGHPRSAGATCALGVVAHHLSYHERRVLGALWRDTNQTDTQPRSLPLETAEKLLHAWVEAALEESSQGIVLLDGQPERCVSLVYRQWLAALGAGAYVSLPRAAASIFEGLFDEPLGPYGVDLEHANTLLSFGVPLLEGWTAPGRVPGRRAGRADDLELIQVESRPSPTALRADEWLQIRPGTEPHLALGLAHILLQEDSVRRRALASQAHDLQSYEQLLRQFPPERVAQQTGLSQNTLRTTARRLLQHGPTVALAGMAPHCLGLDERATLAIAGLHLLLGSLGKQGGYVRRRPLPVPQALEGSRMAPVVSWGDLPDGWIRLLIVDGARSTRSLSWELLQQKLAQDARIVCLSAFDNGLARRAHLVLPTLPFMEDTTEMGPTPDAPLSSYGLALPLRATRAPAVDPAALLLRLVAASTPWLHLDPNAQGSAELIRQRIEALYATRRGTLFDPGRNAARALREVESPAALGEALHQGACWIDEPDDEAAAKRFSFLGRAAAPRAALFEIAREQPARLDPSVDLTLFPFVSCAMSTDSLPPLFTKLVRDSELLPMGGTGFVHPHTASAWGVPHDGWARVETSHGSEPLLVRLDSAVPLGVIYVSIAPDPGDFGENGPALGARVLALCDVNREGTWRPTPARLMATKGRSLREERS